MTVVLYPKTEVLRAVPRNFKKIGRYCCHANNLAKDHFVGACVINVMCNYCQCLW